LLKGGLIMKRIMLLAVAVAVAVLAGTAFAQKPVRDVSHRRHPNLAAAQRLSQQAFEKIVAAQKANEFDMQGHAQKAKELLDQANNELKQAAEAANQAK
jgi:F0F1-type ATP synthase membrane subunit b/b'